MISLQDHVQFSIIARSQASASAEAVFSNYANLQAAQSLYSRTGGGPLSAPLSPAFAFESINVTELQSLGLNNLIAQGRINQSHVEYLIEPIFYPQMPTPQGVSSLRNESYISLTAVVIAPVSRGNVTLHSNQVTDAPVINPGVSMHANLAADVRSS